MTVRDRLRAGERALYQRLRSDEASRAAEAEPVAWSAEALAPHAYCLLVTRRRDGRMVPTPVWFAIDGERIVARSAASDAKVRRIRADPSVLVCACTGRGRPLGPPMRGRARLLDGEAAQAAERALERRYGLQRRLYALVRDPLLDAAYLAVEPPG